MDDKQVKRIEVVAAVIVSGNKIFATQRGYGDQKGMWEFPGGKVEPGESPEEALKREIREELATEIDIDRFLCTVEHDYPAFHLTMHNFICHVRSGHLDLLEHEAARWLDREHIREVDWLPADLKVISRLTMKIYLASSWRNQHYPGVLQALRDAGYEVYDFRSPTYAEDGSGEAFKWSMLIDDWTQWTPQVYREKLDDPLAVKQFARDKEAIESCDTCVLLLPCGRSAHTEAGWFAGNGRKVFVYMPEMQEPELMYKLFDGLACTMDELLELLKNR